jgi:hypothetical protein
MNMKRIVVMLIVSLCLIAPGFDCLKTQKKGTVDRMNLIVFSKKLTNREFGQFFIYPMHDQTIEKIWQDSSNREFLDQLLDDTEIPCETKFLACEVFFKKDILFMRRHPPGQVAEIYAKALSGNFTGMANSWGLLYEHQDDGTVGMAFLTIGKKAIPALSKLLDDERTCLNYEGSAEATTGNGYGYRIKDFAAYYIGRIIGEPLKYYSDTLDRDRQIERLKEVLKSDLFK